MGNRLGIVLASSFAAVALLTLVGCPPPPTPEPPDETIKYFNNTTDATNGGATFVGSAACSACHPEIAEIARPHGHNHALARIQGQPPAFAAEGARAGVPDPPDGKTWADVSYVISGYLHGAFFVAQDGFVMTDGVEGVNTQWNLDFPPNGTVAGFAEYRPNQQTPLPYDYECFRCHTVGPQRQDANNPSSQDGRPGIVGTWAEDGVRCEACHGPGSRHVPNPQARDIFVDLTSATCARCHTSGDDPNVIAAEGGFIKPNTQIAELRASGGHADFLCRYCHDHHASTAYDRDNGIRNECTVCHTDMNLAFHDDAVYVLGDYVEPVTCESCHMPFAARSASVASAEQFGAGPHFADVRSHIFRLSTENADFNSMFNAAGTVVRKDDQGRAALTLDIVCLRCHNEAGNALPLDLSAVSAIAPGIHERAD